MQRGISSGRQQIAHGVNMAVFRRIHQSRIAEDILGVQIRPVRQQFPDHRNTAEYGSTHQRRVSKHTVRLIYIRSPRN